MELSALTAISPVDGRYRKATEDLAAYFSEFGLIKYRVLIEIEYFIALTENKLPQLNLLSAAQKESLRKVVSEFSLVDAQKIKDTEKTTNHDVKAVEYFVKEKLTAVGLEKYLEFVHFGLTSQDINNTAIPLSLKDATHNVLFKQTDALISKLKDLAKTWEA
ncbi:MAG TPA: lyase family protein, partial [Bacteroidia bacterium]|nr:lyase family protein [Bacteroidia bacterium]